MRRKAFLCALTAGALLIGTPAPAAPPADLLAPEPPAAAPAAPTCEAQAAERAALVAERGAINSAIGDIALGRRKKRKVSGGEVAAGVAGTAASVLLPFGVGALLGAGARAAAKGSKKKTPPPPQPDVPAMIERVNAIDARLAALEACG